MANIYLAAAYPRRLEMLDYAAQLAHDGHAITSIWVTGFYEGPEWTPATYTVDDELCITACDVFMTFTENEDAPREHLRGGRHTELGIARALRKRIIIVGPREHSFYHLPGMEQFDSFEEARLALRTGPFLGYNLEGKEVYGPAVASR